MNFVQLLFGDRTGSEASSSTQDLKKEQGVHLLRMIELLDRTSTTVMAVTILLTILITCSLTQMNCVALIPLFPFSRPLVQSTI